LSSKIKALILDRDGTLIEHIPYLACPGKVRLFPGVRESVRDLLDAGVLLFMHTNQSGVGRGYFGIQDVHACNQEMISQLNFGFNPFKRICIAPESPNEPTLYRKPSPNFAFEVMADDKLSAYEICYVGDRLVDLQTAHAAGTHGVGVRTGLVDVADEMVDADFVSRYTLFDSFESAIRAIMKDSQ
jgi:D-glycero-D-manno-heptose 1,7-bisphosphate phosphatase